MGTQTQQSRHAVGVAVIYAVWRVVKEVNHD
jgi:hypothetical protein